MKKLLFITPRNPFSGRYSGDVIRAKKFIDYFKKKYKITVITSDKFNSEKKLQNIHFINFKNENFFFKLLLIFFSIFNLKPMQLGYFYSRKLNSYILNNYQNFDIIFCQSVRAAQYVLDLEIKNKILDMGDLYSNNYSQTFKAKNIFNPNKIIYFIESKLMKRYENLCFEKFSKIFLFSKKEISSLKRNKKKIQQINFGIDKIQRKFKFNKKNNRILFIGNIKYLPNKIACKSFINNILPQINKTHKEIEFHIIGEISKFDAFIWSQNRSVKIHGKISNLNNLLSKTFCGLANLNVSSGIQTKLLTYMSYGIPSVSSKQVLENFDAIHSLSLPKYKNKKELIQLILKLKNEKKFSQNISRKSLKIIKRFTWEKVLKDLNKLSF